MGDRSIDDLQQLKENFNLQEYLEDLGVEYNTEGDNVSEGWVNINCLFCADHADHLGIHYEVGNYFHCWMCARSGDIIDLIRELEHVSFPMAKKRLKDYQHGDYFKRPKKVRKREYENLLPDGFERIEEGREPELVRQYMEERRFPLSICQRYGLGWVPYGEYQLRLIVPVFLSGELMSFQALDMTGTAGDPKLDCPIDRAVRGNKSLLYGIDDVGDQVILVEGVHDKWRIGRDAVAMFGKVLHPAQRSLLYGTVGADKRIKVLVDADAARWNAGEISKVLASLFSDVVVIRLEDGDPDDPADFDEALVRKILEIG